MTNLVLRGFAAIAAAGSIAGPAARAAAQARPDIKANSAYAAKARADSARYPYTAADVHFMQAMIHHHAQALVMARMAPSHGASAAAQVT